MKCEKCGYDDKGTGDTAHICGPLNPILHEEFDRFEEQIAKEILAERKLINLTDAELYEAVVRRGSVTIYDEFLFQNFSLQGRGEVQLRDWAREARDFFFEEFRRKNET